MVPFVELSQTIQIPITGLDVDEIMFKSHSYMLFF